MFLLAIVILEHLLPNSVTFNVKGNFNRLKQKRKPEFIRLTHLQNSSSGEFYSG